MPPLAPTAGAAISSTGELLAVELLIKHQKTNLRLLACASGLIFVLGIGVFAFLSIHGAIAQIGSALANLLTFVSGLVPVSGVISANNRIGELEAAKVLVAKLDMTSNEQELLRELLKK